VPEGVCLLCGSLKEAVTTTCTVCGHRPQEDEIRLAHLFSAAHLSPEELDEASERIASGQRPAPKMHLREANTEQGLVLKEWVWILTGNLLLTPLLGFAQWWGWRTFRPRAARQVLILTLVMASILGVAWIVLMTR